MKVSVVVVAHNEEHYIAKCIQSLLNQTVPADEIVLLAHNTTDQTIAMANTFAGRFPITVIPYTGPTGPAYARIAALTHISADTDILLCIDGDTVAAPNWINEMKKTLMRRGNVLVGSWIKLQGTLHGFLSNIFNKFFCKTTDGHAHAWIWGASMGFWKKDIQYVQHALEQSIALSKSLRLTRNADDYWIALFMSKIGPIEVTNTTHVTTFQTEKTSSMSIRRTIENMKNGNRIRTYWKTGIDKN